MSVKYSFTHQFLTTAMSSLLTVHSHHLIPTLLLLLLLLLPLPTVIILLPLTCCYQFAGTLQRVPFILSPSLLPLLLLLVFPGALINCSWLSLVLWATTRPGECCSSSPGCGSNVVQLATEEPHGSAVHHWHGAEGPHCGSMATTGKQI